MKTRKKKFVLWLYAFASTKDDDWAVVWAYKKDEAAFHLYAHRHQYRGGYVLTAAEFREKMRFGA